MVDVVLIGPDGSRSGTMDKVLAHQPPGHLHEAFSVLLLAGAETLLQQRAASKYHFGGRWTNACCSHPTAGGDVVEQAARRTLEELGVVVALDIAGSFTYRAEDGHSGLVEHEHDTVLVGYLSPEIVLAPDPLEVDQTRWMSLIDLDQELRANPTAYTPWLSDVLRIARSAGHPR